MNNANKHTIIINKNNYDYTSSQLLDLFIILHYFKKNRNTIDHNWCKFGTIILERSDIEDHIDKLWASLNVEIKKLKEKLENIKITSKEYDTYKEKFIASKEIQNFLTEFTENLNAYIKRINKINKEKQIIKKKILIVF